MNWIDFPFRLTDLMTNGVNTMHRRTSTLVHLRFFGDAGLGYPIIVTGIFLVMHHKTRCKLGVCFSESSCVKCRQVGWCVICTRPAPLRSSHYVYLHDTRAWFYGSYRKPVNWCGCSVSRSSFADGRVSVTSCRRVNVPIGAHRLS